MNNIIAIDSYQPQDDDKFFFDTNIWMYLYCPIGNHKKKVIKKYSDFLKKILHAKSSIFISSLVLSEFFNAYTRLEFNILKSNEPLKYRDYKKDFRETDAYKKLAVDIKTTVRTRILKFTERLDDGFSDISLDELFDGIEKSDFNDNYLLTLAANKNMKIVTNDCDFASIGKATVTILTAHNKLLKGS